MECIFNGLKYNFVYIFFPKYNIPTLSSKNQKKHSVKVIIVIPIKVGIFSYQPFVLLHFVSSNYHSFHNLRLKLPKLIHFTKGKAKMWLLED